HRPLRVAAAAQGRIDPDLLQLHGRRRPRGRLRLEGDRAVLDPDPRAALLDLRARAPAEALRIALERVDADLLAMRGRARRNEQLEVAQRRRTKTGVPRR